MRYDFENIIKESWTVFKENTRTYLLATVIAVFGSAFIVTIAPFVYGLNFIAIKGIRTGHVEVSDIFEGFRSGNFIRSWTLLILALLLYLVAISMTYVAGAVMNLLLAYPMFLLIIRESSVLSAIQESIEVVKKNPLESIVLMAIISVLNIAGALALIVGIFVAIPLGEIITARLVMEMIGEGANSSISDATVEKSENIRYLSVE
jgi:uncharacterized membrane protein